MRWRRLGLRREVLLLLPVALLLLVLVSTFTLLSYRSAVEGAVEQRRSEAAKVASALSRQVSPRGVSSALELLAQVPGARTVSLLDADGRPLLSSGEPAAEDLPPELLARAAREAIGVGPGLLAEGSVSGIAPLEAGGRIRYLRVDLPDSGLGSHQRGLRLLAIIVLGVNGAVSLLVFFFLRHLLAPWESMLETARVARSDPPGEEDEIAFLVSTFERAVAAESRRAQAASEDDIRALQRTLAASLESGLLLLDREGRVLALNPVGRQLLHLEGETIEGSGLEEVLGGHRELLSLLQGVVETAESVQRHELEILSPQGPRILGVTVHLLRRDDRSVRGYLALFTDLTETRRRAEEARLEEGLAQLGEMAAGVAHELRNSLATLRGYLTLVERRPGEGDLADYLAEIRRETDHLKRILQDFLLFARPETARVTDVSLEAVLRRAVTDPALGGAAVTFQAEGEPAVLPGDEQLLEHAFRNLLQNAVRAQEAVREREGEEPPEPVTVLLESAGGELRVRVEDRGPGVSEELGERLFRPFVSGFRGGVGLGLAVSHRIVTLHGGRLRLTNRPGGGACAEISFTPGRFVTKGSDSGPAE